MTVVRAFPYRIGIHEPDCVKTPELQHEWLKANLPKAKRFIIDMAREITSLDQVKHYYTANQDYAGFYKRIAIVKD